MAVSSYLVDMSFDINFVFDNVLSPSKSTIVVAGISHVNGIT